MLPTEHASNFVLNKNGILIYFNSPRFSIKDEITQNIYVVVDRNKDDESTYITVGDYYIDDTNLVRKSITSDKGYWNDRLTYKKIIATTNKSLNLPIRVVLNKLNLPKLTVESLEKFVHCFNNKIDFSVKVQYKSMYVKGNYQNKCCLCGEIFNNTDKLGFVCPKHCMIDTDENNFIKMQFDVK